MSTMSSCSPSRNPSHIILVIGASARAATSSLIRAGFRARGLDLFGDVDLPSADVPLSLKEYPFGFEDRLRQLTPTAWLGVGGLENYPELIERLCRLSTHCGMGVQQIADARNPTKLDGMLRKNGFHSAWLRQSPTMTTGRYVLKPRRSAGGLNVRTVEIHESESRRAQEQIASWLKKGNQIQRWIDGEVFGALFFAASHSVEFIGITQQLTGEPSLNAPTFAYCGSIGPIKFDDHLRTQILNLAGTLQKALRLEGMFGIDFKVSAGSCWLLEVNPRYTASVEVLERATGTQVTRRHVDYFGAKQIERCRLSVDEEVAPPSRPTQCAKGVVYVPMGCELKVGESFVIDANDANQGRHFPVVADIPQPGQTLSPGQPAFTVFVETNEETPVTTMKKELFAVADRWWQSMFRHAE